MLARCTLLRGNTLGDPGTGTFQDPVLFKMHGTFEPKIPQSDVLASSLLAVNKDSPSNIEETIINPSGNFKR
jgi:hypothetical protein